MNIQCMPRALDGEQYGISGGMAGSKAPPQTPAFELLP